MFFPMPKGDRRFLLGLIAFSAAGFGTAGLGETRLAGVALFGWWMAALMLLGPLAALWRLWRERRRR